MPSITAARARAILDAIDTDADAGAGAAYINVYNGTMPTNLDTALSGNTLLAELTMTTPNPFGAATGSGPATLTAAAITNDSSANATGTPTFARIFDSDNNPILQVTAGVGSGELNFATSITSGQPVQINSLVIGMSVV